jgi:hypothetical protein
MTVTSAAPAILVLPRSNQWVVPGGSIAIKVVAFSADGAITYQWRHDGLAVAGATTDTLSLANVAATDTGYYTVSLTNAVGTSTATVRVRSMPARTEYVTWGENNYGLHNPPAGLTTAIDVAAHGYHILALKRDGTVAAIGGGNYEGETNVPAGIVDAVAIAAGQYRSEVLHADGTVTSFGGESRWSR